MCPWGHLLPASVNPVLRASTGDPAAAPTGDRSRRTHGPPPRKTPKETPGEPHRENPVLLRIATTLVGVVNGVVAVAAAADGFQMVFGSLVGRWAFDRDFVPRITSTVCLLSHTLLNHLRARSPASYGVIVFSSRDGALGLSCNCRATGVRES